MSDHPTDDVPDASDDTDDAADGGLLERRTLLKGLAITGGIGAGGAGGAELLSDGARAADTSESGWTMQPPQIPTPWTDQVGPDNAHPEYPRPQMVRERWRNLNGVWQFAGAEEGESPPVGTELDERILVPYPVESGLSGIKRHETRMWYRRQFTVSDEWRVPTSDPDVEDDNPNADRLLLHFERVDWEATVYVNGEEVTTHRGGYDHFVADVTDHLVEGGPQELVVGVYDPTGAFGGEPIGTQPIGRQGVGSGFVGDDNLEMTPTSGIWDTVWIEPVRETAHVTDLDVTPDVDGEALRLTADVSADDVTVVASAYDDADELVGRVTGPPNEELEVPVPDPHLWSPDDPYLYDLRVDVRRPSGGGAGGDAGGKLLDRVESYFGMRSLGLTEVNGTARPTLNGEMVWHLGTLESGQWPDGLYTAPTDEALRSQLAAQKELGYNMVRKHVKVEPRRWFYHADQLGLLVWQDMPNMEEYFDTPPRDEGVLDHFETELAEVVTEHDNHPSMAVWIPINEGWGINNENVDYVRHLEELVSDLDPERLVDAHSGYNIGSNVDPETGDWKDMHWYGDPDVVAPDPDPDRVSALGEYTTASLVLEDHKWGECGSEATAEEYLEDYLASVEGLKELMVGRSLSASVFTATTDLENVCNGQITYDREVIKATRAEDGLAQVRAAHESLLRKSRLVMGNVSIDVDAPERYRSAELFGEAEPFEVAATLTNPESSDAVAHTVEDVTVNVSADLPDGWAVRSSGATTVDAVEDGESATATIEVVPDDSADRDVSIDVTVDYAVEGEQYQYDESVTVGASRVGYWRFEESPESSASYDASLGVEGATYADEAVEGGHSLRFDGEDDYAQISAFGSGILHGAFAERTVSTWVNPDGVSGDQVLYNEGGYVSGFGLRIRDGTLEAIAASNNATGEVSAPFAQDGWTHVAVVFDHGALRLFVDGAQVAENPDVGYETVSGHVAASELGGNTTTTPWAYDAEDKFYAGYMDDTAVYEDAFTADELRELGRRSFAVSAPDLYTSGDDAAPVTVDATFSDLQADDGATFEDLSMTLVDLPDGWTAEAQTATTFDSVPGGEYVTATWEVTPAADDDGDVELAVGVDYETGGESATLVDGVRMETLNSSALALWPFDGTTADATGNGHDATLENGASFDDAAVQGSHSVALDGTDDFVDLAEGGDAFLSQAFTERTISMWVDPDATDGSQVLYNQGAAFNGMILRIHDGTLEVGTKSDGAAATVSGPFTATDWVHVAAVFDRGALRLYADGTEIAANEDVGYDTVGGGFWGGEFGGAEVSPFPGWDNGNFGGNVDISGIFPFALSPDQVAALAGRY